MRLFSVAAHAKPQETSNDEGPYLEGVFAREAGPPLILPAKVPEYEPAPLFDADDNSNSVSSWMASKAISIPRP